ncbi:hypothetical protein SAY87_005471 [Trapa incisa]|uniref:Uncharacterized protein n=1 Tax=Trapa incisa TaxID=236973 RepID=A0AAN7Q758_9MYRT|nr:hypothetical protein SAY87_005471 [Trapa incisa]
MSLLSSLFPATVRLLSSPSSSAPAHRAPEFPPTETAHGIRGIERPPSAMCRCSDQPTPASEPDQSGEVGERSGEECSSSKFFWRDL